MSEVFVRPDVATFLLYLNSVPGPKVHELSAPDARKVVRAMRDVADTPTGPIAVLRDLTMPRLDGGTIGLRLFDARADRGPGPVMVFFHGGGWTMGDLDSYEPACAEIARVLDIPVVSVDYRLAPEHPWPAGPDDCEAAARWVASAPEALGLKPTSLVLAGDSAGGTFTIVTAMALRDEPAAVPVIAQWALYPAADLVTHYPSYAEFADGYLLTRDAIAWFAQNYAPDVTHWRGSPMLGSLTGLPPALVTTASLDPIRDQGRAYAAALASAGVAVTFREAAGTIHGFLTLRRAIPSSEEDVAQALAALTSIIAEADRTQ
ncbi:MAG: lipase [Sphingomonas bacterium]|nr:lipase [Sphingomonas bacterium]